jgi:hypothetical protein
MSDIQNLIEKLSQVDMEIISKPEKRAVNEVLETFLGPSSHAKKLERKRVKILQNKKVMLINSHPVANSGHDLIALGNLALSSYKTTELKNEKEAWKNKMLLILNKLENVLISGDEEEIANDYLFLSNAIEQTLKRRKWKGLFRY